MRPRFSLKLLLGAATAVTLWLGWRAQAPRVAKQFAAAVQRGDDTAADALIRDDDDGYFAGVRQIDRWLVRSIDISEFEPAPGVAAWLLNQHDANVTFHILDREAGYGAVTVDVAATPLGVTHSQDGSWVSETPPLLEFLLGLAE